MTEITKIPVSPFWPRHRARTRRPAKVIDPVAFGLALLAAPFVVALMGFWALLIPVVALYFGLPVYLAAFTPAMLALSFKYDITPGFTAFVGVVVNMVACLPPLLWMLSAGYHDVEVFMVLYLGFGSVHAMLWGAAFGWLYGKWKSDKNIPNLA